MNQKYHMHSVQERFMEETEDFLIYGGITASAARQTLRWTEFIAYQDPFNITGWDSPEKT